METAESAGLEQTASDQRLAPPSFAQTGFWLAAQLEPGLPAFNLLRAFRILGSLDLELVHKAFRALVQRHAVLRTSLALVNGELMQVIHEQAEVELPVQELSGLETALAVAAKEGRAGFDLARAPLLRLRLFRLAPKDNVLVLSMHHAVTDGWSMSKLFNEIAEIYGDLAAGRQPRLAATRLSYADYASWQRDHLNDEALREEIAYWKGRLCGHPALLPLPTDRPRPVSPSHRGAIERFAIDEILTARFKALCGAESATLFMGLLAAFQVLLARYSGTTDILVGSPTAGRDDPDLAKVVGCFVNTLVIRTDLSGEPTFAEVLGRVRDGVLGALAHRTLPFERLLAVLQPERTRSHAPLFQAMFILQNAPRQHARLPGLTLEELDVDPGTAKFDLTLETLERDGRIECWLEYNTDTFEAETARRMGQHFRNLLASVVETVDTPIPIRRLELLSPAERDCLIRDWNATEAAYPQDETIASAFSAQAARTPDAVALIEGARLINYRDLDERAAQVAQSVKACGVQPGEPVAVYLPRSGDAYAAILGLLKAGCPYVPLDTAQPRHRLQLLLTNAACRLVLTTCDLRGELPDGIEALLLGAGAAVSPAPLSSPIRATASGDVAYVVWTSGSTGVPKGVMGTHRATMNRFHWMHRAYPFGPGEVCCQKTALGFVDAVWEMFGGLLRGVPTVIVPDDAVLDPDAMIALLAEHRISRIVVVPTLLRVLLDHAPDLGARLPSLRWWTVSGEALHPDLAWRFRRALPGARLLNLYGSAEVAGDATVHEISAEDRDVIPIGKPISNTRIYILDDGGQPVPTGVHGTIHVAGDCLAVGYWGRPDLTAERFLPDPFVGGAIVFATGDRGRYRADGAIEYLGRSDAQTKIRGVRVELGEVEANLLANPGVLQAVVLTTSEAAEQRQLVAFVTSKDGRVLRAEELRGFLRTRLPPAMVPGPILWRPVLPTLPSGKIDRKALLDSLTLGDAPTGAGRSPDGDLERRVAAIWEGLLKLGGIGAEDNFFDLGGNSLLAMQVIARLRKEFLVEVSIRVLFDEPTIAALARAVASGAPVRIPAITPRPEAARSDLADELSRMTPEQIEALLAQVRREQMQRGG